MMGGTQSTESPRESSLSKLPNDCWMHVLDQLSLEDTLSVLLTCKSLGAIAKPFVYRKIDWKWTETPLRRALQLLRLIFKNQEIASYVHHVHLLSSSRKEPWSDIASDMDWKDGIKEYEDVVEQTIDLVQRAQFSDMCEWTSALRDGNFYAFVSILLSQLGNLKSLRLDYSFIWCGGYPGRMLKQALLSPNGVLSRFEHLRVVDYGGNVPMPEESGIHIEPKLGGFPASYNQDQFMAWFCLPTVQHLAIWLRDTKKLEDIEFNLDRLQTLVLSRVTVSGKDVRFILSKVRNLKNLHVGMAYQHPTQIALADGHFLVEGLLSVSHTLERLSLGVEYYPFNLGDREWDQEDDRLLKPFLNILKKFPKLRVAEIPVPILCGWDKDCAPDLNTLLPETLCELHLRDDLSGMFDYEWDEIDIIEYVRQFVGHCWFSTPMLKHITLRLWIETFSILWPDEEQELRLACQEIGIDLSFVVDDLSLGLWVLRDL